jgi:hypothetical protein
MMMCQQVELPASADTREVHDSIYTTSSSAAVASSTRAQQPSAPYLPTDIADNTTNNQDEDELYGMINMDSSGLDDFSPPDMSDARAHVSASYGSADDGFDYQEEEDTPSGMSPQRLQHVTVSSVTAATTGTAAPAVSTSGVSTASPQRQYSNQQPQQSSQQHQQQQQQQQQAHAFAAMRSGNGAAVSSGAVQHARPIMVSNALRCYDYCTHVTFAVHMVEDAYSTLVQSFRLTIIYAR